MATESNVEPYPVVQLVEQYVDDELQQARKYDNRTPLDESGVYSLHCLAAKIYSAGYMDGGNALAERARREKFRDRTDGD